MKHIKKYDNYINEELSPDEKRMILHAPVLIGGFLLKKIFKLFPLLNYRYKEIKKKTNDSKFISIVSSSGSDGSIVKEPWRKITKEDFPKSKLGFGLMLDKWNFYIKEGGNDPSRVTPTKRDFIYITKDEINVGDYITGDRLNDNDVYDLSILKDDKKSLEDFLLKNPAIIVCAKFSNVEKSEDIKVYIEDILIDEWEEYLFPDRQITSNKQSDKFYVTITIDENYTKDLGEKVNRVAQRISGYLSDEGFGEFTTKVNFLFDNKNEYYLLRNFKNLGNINYELTRRLFTILGTDLLNKIDKSPHKNTSLVSYGKCGSEEASFYSINRLNMADYEFKKTTEFMNKLIDNKDLVCPSAYSLNSVSEIKVNKIQFIVEKIH